MIARTRLEYDPAVADEIKRLRARNAALVETLKGCHCPVDNRLTVKHCQQCGCAAGILIRVEQSNKAT